LQRFYCFN